MSLVATSAGQPGQLVEHLVGICPYLAEDTPKHRALG